MKRYNQTELTWSFGEHGACGKPRIRNGMQCVFTKLTIRTDSAPSRRAHVILKLDDLSAWRRLDMSTARLEELRDKMGEDAVYFDDGGDHSKIIYSFVLKKGEEFCDTALKIARIIIEHFGLKRRDEKPFRFDLRLITHIEVPNGWRPLGEILAEKHGFI